VNGYAFAQPGSFLHCSRHFGFGVLIRRCIDAIEQGIAASLVDFDEIRAFLELLPDYANQLRRAVGIGGIRKNALIGIVVNRVFVPADDTDRISADAQARPRDEPLIDGVRTAVSAEPAPSVPMSRSAVKPAIRSSFAARTAAMVRCGTDS
jgi:hypothetical protein